MVAFTLPVLTVFYQGQVASGAKVYVYESGSTTTPITTYSDSGLTTPNSFPITADANGQVVFFIGATTAIRIDLYTSDGAFIKTLDPVYPAANYTSGGSGGEASIVSASTTDLGSTGSNIVAVSGSTTITSFGSSASTASPIYFVRFTGALTLTYNATSLQLPGTANISVAAGDTLTAQYLGSGNWKVLEFTKYDGTPIVGTRFKVGSFTRDTSTASGTQAVTGVGFRPKAVLLFANQGGTKETSFGFSDGTNNLSVFQQSTAGSFSTNSSAITDDESSGVSAYTGSLSSLDSDGFTVTWTRTGTPTGTLSVNYLAMG